MVVLWGGRFPMSETPLYVGSSKNLKDLKDPGGDGEGGIHHLQWPYAYSPMVILWVWVFLMSEVSL